MNNIKRKIKKLVRDPKLFFKDMYQKRVIHLKQKRIIKHKTNNQYTIVSAVYNVASYLDEYFISITKQTLSFKNHIHIILVDDGSTDNSAEIIKKWQKKYPKNIHYIYKENGGQASARNLGLEYVNTEWVVFTDPDDFLHPDYFKSVDECLNKTPSASILATNIKLFIENQNLVKDSHPLRFRFNETHIEKVKNLDKFINLSSASTFFKVAHIQKKHLKFNDKVKPNFEDGKFIADYLIDLQNTEAIFDKGAIYFYRKRDDSSSTLDTSWKKEEKYSNIFEFGFIPMLKKYKAQLGVIPNYIQKTALYDMSWYVQYLLNRPERINFLNKEQKEKFYSFMKEVFLYIDEKNITESNFANTWMFHKVGMLGAFKNAEPPFQIVYIENIDRERKQFLASYFSYFDYPYSIQINNQEIIPEYEKTVVNTLNNALFNYEKRLWIPYGELDCYEKLHFFLNKKAMRISIKGKTFTHGITIEELTSLFSPSEKYHSDGSWLLMDRETKADDNAEHLYRYMMKNHPEQKCYFALNKTAPDWKRLERDGFNLVEFGSKEFETCLRRVSKIISSHLEKHINNYFNDFYEDSKKFVFLQHGVTVHDLSTWINSKRNLHCFITVTNQEHESIVANFNNYKLTEKEVILAGFPRYDNLSLENKKDRKSILIMPTWRKNIVGENIGIGSNTRTLNKAFMQTDYAQHWYKLLHSDKLKELADKYQYEIFFAPHPNIEPYLEMFNVPGYINVWSMVKETTSVQKLFGFSSILITDYSSVAFDMAYLNKAIIYYQFDKNSFFSGEHTTQHGYFKYENDGFGPVTETQEQVLSELEKIMIHGRAESEYLKRIQKTFQFQDNRNCQRVYQAIVNLDSPEKNDNISVVKNMLAQAENYKEWNLVGKRIFNLLQSKKLNDKEYDEYEQRYLSALFNDKDFVNLLNYLTLNKVKNMSYWQAKVDLKIGNIKQAAKYFADNKIGSQEDRLIATLAAALSGDIESVEILSRNLSPELPIEYSPLLLLAEKISQQEYFVAISLIENLLEQLSSEDKYIFKLELLASYICMQLNNLKRAHDYLVRYENHSKNDPSCRIAIARLAKLRHNDEKLFTQMNRAFEDNLLLIPEDLVPNYLRVLEQQKNIIAEETLLTQFREKYPQSQEIALYKAEKLYRSNEWQALTNLLIDYIYNSERAMYLYALALCRLGQSEDAQNMLNIIPKQDTFKYWKLVAETAELKKDKALLKYSIEKQLETL